MKTIKILLLIVCAMSVSGCMTPKGKTVMERQTRVQEVKAETLDDLYAKVPESESKMEQAVGYGVFKNMGAAFLIGGGANGFGTITDKESGEETYMRAASGSLGFGFGIKNYRLVILFYDPAVMNNFVNTGWDFGANASATLKSEGEGGDATGKGTFKRSMDIYEFTKEGIFLRADLNATRFWPDKGMNIE